MDVNIRTVLELGGWSFEGFEGEIGFFAVVADKVLPSLSVNNEKRPKKARKPLKILHRFFKPLKNVGTKYF